MNEVINAFKENNIDYRIIEINEQKKLILMRKEDAAKITESLVSCEYTEIEHPKSKKRGYTYLYALTEFKMFKKNDALIEIWFELACASLTPSQLLPLDKAIQKDVWESYREEKGNKYLDEILYYIFHITQGIFIKHGFDEKDKSFLDNNEYILNNARLEILLKKIFFSFTQELICLLRQKKYENIYSNYIAYLDY